MSTYRLTALALLKSLGLAALLILPLVTVAALMLMLPESMSGGLFFLLFLPIILTCGLSVFLSVLAVGVFVHRLKLTPEGLEYQRWPLKQIAATWAQVEGLHIGKKTGSATLLVHRIKPGFELDLGFMTLGSKDFKLIPLSDFTGWKDGRIALEMKKFAPKLFADQPVE